jgi:hypothetical protein
MLRELLTSGMKPRLIAQNHHRSRSIMNFLFKKPRKRLPSKRP